MLQVNQKCGACNKSLTGGYVLNYSGIGQPFVNCPACGSTNDNSVNVTEWKLKSFVGKAFFILRHIISVIFFYGIGGLIFPLMLGAVILDTNTAEKLLINNLGFVIIAICSVVFGLTRFFVRLGRAIRASNARMDDVSYLEVLRHLGLAK